MTLLDMSSSLFKLFCRLQIICAIKSNADGKCSKDTEKQQTHIELLSLFVSDQGLHSLLFCVFCESKIVSLEQQEYKLEFGEVYPSLNGMLRR